MTKYNRNPKVSIIIPIYNAQMHLKRCIDSVLKQDFEDFELLLMDDGSKDSSPESAMNIRKRMEGSLLYTKIIQVFQIQETWRFLLQEESIYSF